MNEARFKLLHDIRKVFMMLEDEIIETMAYLGSFNAASYKIADPVKNAMILADAADELRDREEGLREWIDDNAEAEYQQWLTDNNLTDIDLTKYNL